jgi:hypothetical protein
MRLVGHDNQICAEPIVKMFIPQKASLSGAFGGQQVLYTWCIFIQFMRYLQVSLHQQLSKWTVSEDSLDGVGFLFVLPSTVSEKPRLISVDP